MATEKQIQANRLNARKGGVKTRAGKNKVRLNAVTHGFFSKNVMLPGEDHRLMAELREKLTAEIEPQGEMETLLMELIISNSWRLKRVLNNECKNTRANVDYRFSHQENIMRYVTTLERQIYKAIHELTMLQNERFKAEAYEATEITSILAADPSNHPDNFYLKAHTHNSSL